MNFEIASPISTPIDLTTPRVIPKRRSSFFNIESTPETDELNEVKFYIEKLEKEKKDWIHYIQQTNLKVRE